MAEPPARNRRVLIVDGDSAFRETLERDFTSRGFDVENAGTREEAIAHVAAAPPDLVVLHLCLGPVGAALELLRRWKIEQPALIVILVSSDASLGLVVDALKEGARRFFVKPIAAATIIDELEERRSPLLKPYLSPLLADSHQLSLAALQAEGVDRFFAVSPGLLCVAGFDGYFKLLNPAWEKVLGYSIDELCSKPQIDLVHPDDRQKATDEALEICAGQTVFRYKNRYCCKDGSYRWLAWSATPSPAHRLIYASARDITNQVRMELGLRESNARLKQSATTLIELGRFKDEVSAMLVHDLKNPLSVIVSNYEYVLEGFEGSADCLEALRDSQSAGRRMLRLLANLLDVARLERGTLDVCAKEVSLAKLVEPVATQRRVLAQARQITIVLASAPELVVTVDADLMTRAVENIFDNALRHTPEGGSIEIEMRDAGANVEVRIGNSGCAIPVETRDAIFDKSCQGDNVGRMNLGLGLYFCRLAIEAQGGKIWVEETERLPTVFGIRLPRRLADAPRPAPSEPVMVADR
jgi:PAS domain S-box-containing protein